MFWFYLILKMAYRIMIVGEVEKDVRSDDDELPEEEKDPSTMDNNKTDKKNDKKKR